ncbi:MAG: GntR family transcriptional regulator [Pseudomonadota bacterium]
MSTNEIRRGVWLDAYRGLREDIERGRLAPGQDLPTLSALAKTAGLTSHGARRVMDRLRQDGHVQAWQGKGFRVAIPKIRLNLRAKRPAFREHMEALGWSSNSEVIAGRSMRLTHELARRMRQRSGTKVISTETIRKVNGRAVALSTDYFLQDRLSGIDATLAETGSVSRSLAAHGVPTYKRDITSLEARLPSAHEALVLSIPKNQPIYMTLGANCGPDGDIVQLSRGVWRADCVVYEF